MTADALDDDLPEIAHSRPVWLTTLADLALLLVGFFVFIQASQHVDKAALARGMREGFGVQDSAQPVVAPVVAEPMAVSAGAMRGFAPGSAILPERPDALIGWARDATRGGRVSLRVSGGVDGSDDDVDPATGSGAVLATDRARAVAALLLVAHAVPANRITIVAAAQNRGRSVIVTTGFAAPTAGGRQ